jgi:hypothetical protein
MMDRGQDMAPHRLDYYLLQARRHAASGLFRKVALLAMASCLGPGAVSGTRELFNRFDEVSVSKVPDPIASLQRDLIPDSGFTCHHALSLSPCSTLALHSSYVSGFSGEIACCIAFSG